MAFWQRFGSKTFLASFHSNLPLSFGNDLRLLLWHSYFNFENGTVSSCLSWFHGHIAVIWPDLIPLEESLKDYVIRKLFGLSLTILSTLLLRLLAFKALWFTQRQFFSRFFCNCFFGVSVTWSKIRQCQGKKSVCNICYISVAKFFAWTFNRNKIYSNNMISTITCTERKNDYGFEFWILP